MNYVKLKGIIRNICFSHKVKDTEYDKADIIVKRFDGEDDILSLRFKKFSNPYKDDQEVELCGHIRSYSQKLDNGKNKVEIYVFTYFDLPSKEDSEEDNIVELDGRICKLDELRVTKNGKHNIHFVLANNIISADGSQKINNYISCVAWGNLAKQMSKLKISDKIDVKGQLHSRTYKKHLDNGEVEIRTAHEVVILDFHRSEEKEEK